MVRRLRKSRDSRARLPEAYAYDGSNADVDRWVRTLVAETGNFTHPATGLLAASRTPRRTRWRRPDALDVADVAIDVGTSGEGGGGVDIGGLLDADEFALAILAILAIVVVAVIAVPLGLLAIELVLTLGVAAAGVVLRLARIKPWTVLVLRDGIVVAAVAVKGWRSSRAVLVALRQQLGVGQY
ncbi:MAG: hypothetical protein QOE23_1094 [Pseudonocardiales bacterium]|nr:hypothetical protein [Pseudonocardiales bacterium]